jgi:hypothetical protein
MALMDLPYIESTKNTHHRTIKMQLEDLEHIFRFQTTASEEFTPKSTVEYMIFEGQNRITKTHDAKDLKGLLPLLDNFIHDGYRDRMPLFVKPETIIPL